MNRMHTLRRRLFSGVLLTWAVSGTIGMAIRDAVWNASAAAEKPQGAAVKRVLVNGRSATATVGNFAEWGIVLDSVKPGTTKLSAHAEDAAGNVEKLPHTWTTKY
jgi:hypothetical protein